MQELASGLLSARRLGHAAAPHVQGTQTTAATSMRWSLSPGTVTRWAVQNACGVGLPEPPLLGTSVQTPQADPTSPHEDTGSGRASVFAACGPQHEGAAPGTEGHPAAETQCSSLTSHNETGGAVSSLKQTKADYQHRHKRQRSEGRAACSPGAPCPRQAAGPSRRARLAFQGHRTKPEL